MELDCLDELALDELSVELVCEEEMLASVRVWAAVAVDVEEDPVEVLESVLESVLLSES